MKSARAAVVLPMLLIAALAPARGEQRANPSRAVGCTELASWLAGGISNARLAQLVDQRGTKIIPTAEVKEQLKSAGAEAVLLASLAKQAPVENSLIATCPAEVVKAAGLVRQRQYDAARKAFRDILHTENGNGAVHFALGAIQVHENSWEDALAEFTESARLMPGLAETHSRLSYLFYHSGDPDNAIAEARTALSLDPGNPEAYKFLGLALSDTGQHEAALHAFGESLAKDPANSEVFYLMGGTLRDKGDLSGAAAAYRRAIEIDPQ